MAFQSACPATRSPSPRARETADPNPTRNMCMHSQSPKPSPRATDRQGSRRISASFPRLLRTANTCLQSSISDMSHASTEFQTRRQAFRHAPTHANTCRHPPVVPQIRQFPCRSKRMPRQAAILGTAIVHLRGFSSRPVAQSYRGARASSGNMHIRGVRFVCSCAYPPGGATFSK